MEAVLFRFPYSSGVFLRFPVHHDDELPRPAVLAARPDRLPEPCDPRVLLGKIAFGIDYNGALVNPDTAISRAFEAYEDGLFRVFCNNVELKGLDAPVKVGKDDVFTFVRLVALSGSMW